ncbi:MAG: hypothetical protein GY804_12770 [Alphaproteobacteria bacterium]|nr:hypothetical protein [Alphaproteobacteria bacterium]
MLERYYKKGSLTTFCAVVLIAILCATMATSARARSLSFSNIHQSVFENKDAKNEESEENKSLETGSKTSVSKDITANSSSIPFKNSHVTPLMGSSKEGSITATTAAPPSMPNKNIGINASNPTKAKIVETNKANIVSNKKMVSLSPSTKSNSGKSNNKPAVANFFEKSPTTGSSTKNTRINKVKINTPSALQATPISRLTPSQQLLKKSNQMFDLMADIEQKNALLELELEHEKLLTEIINVRIAKEKIEDDEKIRKKESDAKNDKLQFSQDASFKQSVQKIQPPKRAFSLTNNNQKPQPIQQQMYNGRGQLGNDMPAPPMTNQNGSQQLAIRQPAKPPTSKPTPKKEEVKIKKRTSYTISFITGVAGKLKATLKASDGKLIDVAKGDTLPTGQKIVSLEIHQIVLEKEGKREVIPMR